MNAFIAIDVAAVIVAVIGFHLGFRQGQLRSWWAQLRHRGNDLPISTVDRSEYDPMDSVLRTAGVMLMAFSLVGCAFANLIAYYKSASVY